MERVKAKDLIGAIAASVAKLDDEDLHEYLVNNLTQIGALVEEALQALLDDAYPDETDAVL